MTSTTTITLQQATADDDEALRTLSALDSARPLQRPALLALVDGRSVAAASLTDERVVADPFTASADAVRLLSLHRSALRGRRPGRLRPTPLKVPVMNQVEGTEAPNP